MFRPVFLQFLLPSCSPGWATFQSIALLQSTTYLLICVFYSISNSREHITVLFNFNLAIFAPLFFQTNVNIICCSSWILFLTKTVKIVIGSTHVYTSHMIVMRPTASYFFFENVSSGPPRHPSHHKLIFSSAWYSVVALALHKIKWIHNHFEGYKQEWLAQTPLWESMIKNKNNVKRIVSKEVGKERE